ncbi:MAG: hypothetical protein GY913_01440 [Proteobacteria bacterium]|nr:hypothetical protein [Pseudomonadota bacterium]MCP4915562.1 hypothetical protein [Pseudomonadota bacterium]
MRAARPWALAALGYALVVAVVTWPLVLHPGTMLPGFPNIDLLDTVTLRGLFLLGDTGAFFPVGYPVATLLPNVADHASGALLSWLPFPLSDTTWWLLVLLANGMAAHWMGWRLSGEHTSAALAGVAWLCSDALLREVNLHHAPQALVFFAPLYIGALVPASKPGGSRRDAVLAGLFLAGAGISYWYYGLFLGLATLPFLRKHNLQQAGVAAGVALLVAAPFLIPTMLGASDLPLADPSVAPAPLRIPGDVSAIPEELQFLAQRGSDPLFPFEAGPIDRSNKLSLVLMALGAIGAWKTRDWRFVVVGLLGYVMVLGPWLKWGDNLVLVGESPLSLPFRWLGSLHPFLARLHWSDRWGFLIPLALAALAVRVPKAGYLAPLVLLEAVLTSLNAPIQTWDLSGLEGWRALEASDGAVLELPLKRSGLQTSLVGLHARYHGKAVVNPLMLPPGEHPPDEWMEWMDAQPLTMALKVLEGGDMPPEPGADAVRSLGEAGVGAIALDALPGSILKASQVIRNRQRLSKVLGDPEDHGCVLVWWVRPPMWATEPMEDGPQWRQAVQERYQQTGRPHLDTLIEPTWNSLLKAPEEKTE